MTITRLPSPLKIGCVFPSIGMASVGLINVRTTPRLIDRDEGRNKFSKWKRGQRLESLGKSRKMVKAVIGEETQLNSADNRLTQSRLTSQVGLIVGKISARLDRGFAYDLIPTPANDAGEAACSLIQTLTEKKKGGGSKSQSHSGLSSLSVDKDWVAEHARQVSRMLLGGMKVVGIYIWADEISFKNSTLTICQTVKGVAEAAPLSDCDERLLIHISYSPRRWTCRNCTINSNITSSSLHPCDFKMGRVLTSLQKFRCTYNFDVRLPVCRGSRLRQLSEILRHEILRQCKELKAAKALIDGKLVIVDDQCAQEGLHEVEFLLPFMQDSSVEARSQKEVEGVVSYNGSVCSFAYLNPKESISQALADLKGDIITSLESRLDIICDEAAETVGDVELDTSAVSQSDIQRSRKVSFPRRVFVPWLEGTYICDYLQPSETLEVVKDHCIELMSMEADTNGTRILELESETSVLTTAKSFWELTRPAPATTTERGGDGKKCSSSPSTTTFNLTAAFLVLFFAILVGMLLLLFRRGTF